MAPYMTGTPPLPLAAPSPDRSEHVGAIVRAAEVSSVSHLGSVRTNVLQLDNRGAVLPLYGLVIMYTCIYRCEANKKVVGQQKDLVYTICISCRHKNV